MDRPFETDEQRRQREFVEGIARNLKRAMPYVAPVVAGLAFVGIVALVSKK